MRRVANKADKPAAPRRRAAAKPPSARADEAARLAQRILRLTEEGCHCLIGKPGDCVIINPACPKHGWPYALVTVEVYIGMQNSDAETLRRIKEALPEVLASLNVGGLGVDGKVRLLRGKTGD